MLGVLGIELSLNSPNARRRDYLYALADHPSRKVSGEKLDRIRHARKFATEHGILPVKEPRPIWTYWGHEGPSPFNWSGHSGSSRSSSAPERSVERSRSDWTR